MLVSPFIWSAFTSLHVSNNLALPSAYDGRDTISLEKLPVDQELLNFLQSNTHEVYYLVAVPSSMEGADLVLATGRPVLYMGGFNGEDQVVTPLSLAQLVVEGKLRFITGIEASAGQSEIADWVTSNCQVVKDIKASHSNIGLPYSLLSTSYDGVLYDCKK
jgi:4-amino-4-deoxy-L-arabinose transferase-like glycosyltransferase